MTENARSVAEKNQRRTAPSTLFTVAGHAVAGVIFWYVFTSPVLRPQWLPQFYVLLFISLLITLYAIHLRRNLFRMIALLNVMVLHVVLTYPDGPNLSVRAVMGTIFVVVTMLEIEGPFAYVLSGGYALTLALNEWSLTVWESRISAPLITTASLLAAYFCFLAWLGGLVGSQAQEMRRQREEIARLDRTVTTLSNANLDFQEWGTRLQRETEEQERKRIAREIHDIVGHTLTNIQMMMEAGTDLADKRPAALNELLLQSRDQAQRGLLETRRAIRNFRSVTTVQPEGLRRIVEVVRIFQNATKVAVELNLGNAPPSLGGGIDDVVYRMIQEGLTNAIRHGNASRVSVSLWVVEGAVRVTIKDDGAGSKTVVQGMGLLGMSERLSQLGGSLRTDSNRYGFSVYAEIPFGVEKKT